MNGQMMNYKRYLESLENTPEPTGPVLRLQIDYKGLIKYARSQGKMPNELSDEERAQFIVTKKKNIPIHGIEL